MCKKLISLLTALCLMLSLAPAAFAAEAEQRETIIGPNGQVYEVPDLENVPQPLSTNGAPWEGSGSSSNPYRIYDAEDFVAISGTSYATNYSSFKLMGNIDLSGYQISAWNGALQFFYGNIDGNGKTITGLQNDRFLIYGWYGGTLKNFTFDLDGEACGLTFLYGTVGGNHSTFKLDHVTTVSDTRLELATGENNYSPFVYSIGGTFEMVDCVNEVNIHGEVYAAVFFGFYPQYAGGTYTFTRCINKGNISMRHAALFFGNSTGFANNYGFTPGANVSEMPIRFVDCENNGVIKGTLTASYFAALAGGDSAICQQYEAYLEEYLKGNGRREQGACPAGLAATISDSGAVSVQLPTEPTDITSYELSVYSYVKLIEKTENDAGSSSYKSKGTIPFGTNQTLTAAQLAAGSTFSVKAYGVCDYPVGDGCTATSETINGIPIVSRNGINYYHMKWGSPALTYYQFVNESTEYGTIEKPDVVTLTAYGADGNMVCAIDVKKIEEAAQ